MKYSKKFGILAFTLLIYSAGLFAYDPFAVEKKDPFAPSYDEYENDYNPACEVSTWLCTSRSNYRNYYGAISYSPSTGSNGISYDYKSKKGAKSRAIKECSEDDCVDPIWVMNACAALAVNVDESSIYAMEWGSSKNKAINKAIQACEEQ